MSYNKRTINNNDPSTPVSAENLNYIQTQYDEAVAYTNAQVASRPTSSQAQALIDSSLVPYATTASVSTALAAKANSSTVTAGLAQKANTADLATVAQTGAMSDLSGRTASNITDFTTAVQAVPGFGSGGGTAGVSSVNTRTGAVTLSKSDVGLANADNTADAAKPVSTAQQAALDGKAAVSHTHPASQITDFTTAVQAVPGFGGGGGGSTNPTYVRDIREWVQSGETLTRDRTGDNSAIIQRAVNALTAEYAAQTTTFSANKLGYQIYFPNGRYRTATKITWKTGVGITGQSRENVVFYPVGDQSFIDGSTTPNTYTYDDCIFDNFSVDGSEQAVGAYTTGVKGIFIQYMRRAVFQFVTVRNTWATGFGVDFLETGRFSQCAAINNGRGLTVLGSNKSSSSGHSGFGIGVGFWPVEAVTIEDCVALNNGLNGIFTEKLEANFAKGLIVTGCISRGNYNGFKDAGSIGAIVANNQFLENSKNGVTIDGTVLQPLAGYDGLIVNNYIQGNGVGVRLGNMQPTKGYTIRGNEITGNVGAGVEALSTAVIGQRTKLVGNRIHENLGIGCSIATASTMLTIRDNEFFSNTGSDLSFTGSVTATSLVITDNDLRGATVVLSQTIASDSVFRNNLGFATNSPRSFNATAADSTTINASWVAPLEGTPDSYTLQYKKTADSTWTAFTLSSSTALTATITGLIASTSYDLRLNAVKGSVTSDWVTKTVSTTSGGGGGSGTILYADNFNRANTGAGGMGSTSTGSAAWSAPDWGIISNTAQAITAGPSIATFEAASTDHLVEATLAAKPSTVGAVLIARYLGSSAWVGLSTASGGNWYIQAYTGSFVTVLDTGVAWAVGQRVGLRVSGNSFTAYVNGSDAGTATSTVGATGTKVGLRASLNGIGWDDYTVTSL